MTSAKPQAMAAQTEAPDDLISELARLMADDARAVPSAANEQRSPVRIPGDAATMPGPRFDFSASANLASGKVPASPVRIPGEGDSSAKTAEPFAFKFDIAPSAQPELPSTPVASAPVTSVPLPAASVRVEPNPENEPALDHDSLADLIAAELATDLGQDRASAEPPVPAADPVEPAAKPDRFGVPPVFGLGSPHVSREAIVPQPEPESASATAKEAPAPDHATHLDTGSLDPLEEIERLVGPAVRMNVDNASPISALRSLATPVVSEPVVAQVDHPATLPPAPQHPEVNVNSVDEAILAAAAATGAHVEWVNAGTDATATDVDDLETAMPTARSAGFAMNRAIVGPLVAVGLLAVAGLGLYWALGQGGGTAGPAPLLVADTAPTKEVPEVDAASTAPQSVVFNEISGADVAAEEQIVSRDQADTEAVVAANSAMSGSGVVADVAGGDVDPNQDGLVNRKVRTVTVRPDGTIVSGEDSLAGSAILPVDRPNVPEVPGADFSTPDLIASATPDTDAAAIAATPETTATPAVPPAEPGATIAVVDSTGAPLAGRTVTMPMQRPSDFSTIAASATAAATAPAASAPIAPTATAPAAVAPAQQAVTTTSTGTTPAYVQLASQRSEEAARQSAQAISTRYGLLFSGASPEIRRVDLGERGVYYRVVVPATSRDGAANICVNVKAAGGDCLLL
ncbi:SPOR domain-containing protein [Devosia sp. CAU 1758]